MQSDILKGARAAALATGLNEREIYIWSSATMCRSAGSAVSFFSAARH